ncbi:hypothetical protein GOA57_08365 [Sinorhizobium meliloti]|uniref:hypothetical protein n=1 Tax=Rhizobium meliloti TaxID=382 RepID=UPI0004148D38|nr:hypothetical protein [Sinorhizobium meliloti]MDW9459947.1 hypothetical protein [Sinorhizobium meliloti]
MILDGVPPQGQGAQETDGAALYGSPARAASTPFTGGDLTAMPRSFSGGAVLRAYNPTLRDRLADRILGDGRPSLYKRQVVSGLLGSAGLGNEGLSLIDVTPFGTMFAGEETGRSLAEGNYGQAAVEALGMLPAPALRTAMKGARAFGAKAGIAESQDAGFLASRSAYIYDPPVTQPRPFEAEYKPGDPRYEAAGGTADESGRLRMDMDGRPLTGEYVAGRTHTGAGESPIPASAYDAIAKAATGGFPQTVAKSKIGGDAGRYVVTRDRRSGEVLNRDIYVDQSLPKDKASRVTAHELAHALNEITGNIPTDGLDKELRTIYNDLNNPQSYGKLFGREQNRYSGAASRTELMTEAIRAYMSGPSYIKTVAPASAKRIRAYVNTHPKLKHIIQFNSIAPLMGTGLAGGGGLAGFKESGRGEGEL